MSDGTPNSSQSATGAPPSADNATAGAENFALAPELGPNGNPINPPDGEAPPTVEASFIMDTFFGEGTAEPSQNPAGAQAQGSQPAGGQSQQGSLAPPAPAPAANGGEGSPEPGPSPTQPGQQQEGGEGAASQTPGQGQPTSPEPQPTPQLSVEDRLRLASANALVEQNRQLIERLRQLEQQSGGPQPQAGSGQQPQPNQPGGAQEPPLRLVVPDELYSAVMDENPATSKQGLSLLITAVAQNAVEAAVKRITPIIDQRMQAVTQALQTGEQVQKQEQAYFDRFPAHNNPLFKPLIQEVVQAKYQQFPHAAWDEIMMDAVGATVNEKLKALGIDPSNATGGQQQPAPNGQTQTNGNGSGQPRPKPAPMLDGSTRAAKGVPQDAGDFIRSTFG